MSLTQIVSTIWLSAVLLTWTGANLEQQKKEKKIQFTASKLEKLITLSDTTRHTFVIDENNSITLLLNQFQTIHWWVEKYLQVFDCALNEYTIYVRDDHYQVSVIDNKNESVVRFNESMLPKSSESDDNQDDVKDPVPSVREIIKRIQLQGSIKPFVTDDGIVYKLDCV
jgi:hypothetical protein